MSEREEGFASVRMIDKNLSSFRAIHPSIMRQIVGVLMDGYAGNSEPANDSKDVIGVDNFHQVRIHPPGT